MKIISFNINGLRARLHQLHEIITQFQPDIIGLQETKVDDNDFPIEKISKYGYFMYYYGQKGHYGVAIFSKKKIFNIRRGFPHENHQTTQKRIIMADIESSLGNITIINGYSPQGENIHHSEKFTNKKMFYQNLKSFIKKNYNANSLLFVMGDMNISPTNLDVGINKKKQINWLKKGKCSFLPEERIWINELLNLGLIDVFRYVYPKNNSRCYSWFDYRSNHFKINQGLRIDLLLATCQLVIRCKNIDIKYEIRTMNKPSDHAPIFAEFDI